MNKNNNITKSAAERKSTPFTINAILLGLAMAISTAGIILLSFGKSDLILFSFGLIVTGLLISVAIKLEE